MFLNYEKIITFTNKPKVKWALLSLLTFIVLLKFVSPNYSTNDDMNLIFIANGGLSYPSSHLVYTNIILGSLLKHLFAIIPMINWYTVISLFAFFSSFYLFTSQYLNKIHYFTLILFEIFTYFIGIYHYNYTSVAILIALFTSLILMDRIQQKKLNLTKLLFVSVLYILSSWIRFDSWGLAILLLLPLYIKTFIDLLKNKSYYSIGYCTLLLVLISGCFIFDKALYQNESFVPYKQYENILHTINDYEYIPDYSTKYSNEANFYVSQGISVNSFDLLRKYTYADDSVYSYNRLNAIASHINQTAFQLKDLGNKLITYFKSPTHMMWLLLTISVLIYLVIYRKHNDNIYMLIGLLIGCIIIISYIHLNRYPDRIGFALPFIALLFALMQIQWMDSKPNYLSLLSMLAYILWMIFSYQPINQQSKQAWINDLNELNKDQSNVYVYDGFSPLLSLNYSFNFFTMQVPSIDNTYRLGGWLYQLPVNEDILKRNGYDNGFACLLDKNHPCYLASNEVGSEKVFSYLKEHYNENILMLIEKEYTHFTIYKFIAN